MKDGDSCKQLNLQTTYLIILQFCIEKTDQEWKLSDMIDNQRRRSISSQWSRSSSLQPNAAKDQYLLDVRKTSKRSWDTTLYPRGAHAKHIHVLTTVFFKIQKWLQHHIKSFSTVAIHWHIITSSQSWCCRTTSVNFSVFNFRSTLNIKWYWSRRWNKPYSLFLEHVVGFCCFKII